MGEDFATVWTGDSLCEFHDLYIGQQPGCLAQEDLSFVSPSLWANRSVLYPAAVVCQLKSPKFPEFLGKGVSELWILVVVVVQWTLPGSVLLSGYAMLLPAAVMWPCVRMEQPVAEGRPS